MGICFSKKKASSSSSLNVTNPISLTHNPHFDSVKKAQIFEAKTSQKTVQEDEVLKKAVEEESLVKKEVFVIKHRKSHDKNSTPVLNLEQVENSGSISTNNGEMDSCNNSSNVNGGNVVRTSSCTKEEVDAILIQCGRLSRSNSSGVAKGVMSSGRKYSGSKRSFDFDNNDQEIKNIGDCPEGNNLPEYEARRDGNDGGEERRQHRHRHRESGRHSSPSVSQGRRRTPSRERDQQNRSGSRERGTGSTGRRVSRSPGRRSEDSTNNTTANATNSTNSRPAKMVSVPATVSSLNMDRSNNGVETQNVKRVIVKRNVGAASPRAQSPARNLSPARAARSTNENTQHPSLSRNPSRKADQSPYRRNPLSELDPNSLVYPTGNSSNTRGQVQKQNVAETKGTNIKGTSSVSAENKVAEEQHIVEEQKVQQTITRTRSGRRSRDLDINPEDLLSKTPSYATLLLKDIQNFHQKNTITTSTPPFSLPQCVTKACSILEAVADLNSSTTSSNISCTISDDRRSPPPIAATLVAKKQLTTKDPIVESEINVADDLTEPSLHKYVTVRRGGTLDIDMEGQESSGSNSFVGGGSQQQWTSSWEPNSAESTDRWTSRSNSRDEGEMEEGRRGFSGQRRSGIGRGRVGGNVYQNQTVAT